MTSVILAAELTRRFGEEVALDSLDLEVEAGEVIALLGPNGAGKTTTVRLLNGVLRPDGGSASVLGFDVATQADELRRHTGVLTENAGLDERLTARENLVFTGRIRGMATADAERRTDTLLEQFGMADKAHQLPGGFSTGQRKRVALARSLLHDPEVLFLDEPTSGLDPAATRDVAQLITELASGRGRTVVLATHFLGEAGRLADRMAVLHNGRLEAIGRPDDLARDLWPTVDLELELNAPPDASLLAALRNTTGVDGLAPTEFGVVLHVAHRDVVPHLTRLVVESGLDLFTATLKTPSLEDVYFEIESRVRGGQRQIAEMGPKSDAS